MSIGYHSRVYGKESTAIGMEAASFGDNSFAGGSEVQNGLNIEGTTIQVKDILHRCGGLRETA